MSVQQVHRHGKCLPRIEEEIMKPYAEMTKEELLALRKELKAQYREMQGKDLKLDMSRGCLLYTSRCV